MKVGEIGRKLDELYGDKLTERISFGWCRQHPLGGAPFARRLEKAGGADRADKSQSDIRFYGIL